MIIEGLNGLIEICPLEEVDDKALEKNREKLDMILIEWLEKEEAKKEVAV